MNHVTNWQLVPAAPTQDWTNAFAARGPRIGTFDKTIRDVLATAPAPNVDVVQELQAVRAALAFLPPGDAAVVGLDRVIGHLNGEAKQDPATPGAAPGEQRREAVMEAIAGALGNAYDCMRAWSAWGVGTMNQDDFALVAEDSDRLAELADAAIAALHPTAGSADQQDAVRYRGWRSAALANHNAFAEVMWTSLPRSVQKGERVPTADEWDIAVDVAIEAVQDVAEGKGEHA